LSSIDFFKSGRTIIPLVEFRVTALDLALVRLKYDSLPKSQKRASISFNEFTLKTGCTSPFNSLFLTLRSSLASTLSSIILRDKVFANHGKLGFDISIVPLYHAKRAFRIQLLITGLRKPHTS
jgi:hypothetical protein